MTNRLQVAAPTFSVLMIALTAASAASQTGPLVCSVVKAVECDDSLNCQAPLADPPPPTFIHVDVEAEVITLLAPESRRGEQTRIGSMTRQEGETILMGAEAARGWSMVISDDDLAMTFTITEDRTAFAVFGACIREDQVRP